MKDTLKKKEAVPSGSGRDAVSVPREFAKEFANFKSENKKITSFKHESFIHSRHFALKFDCFLMSSDSSNQMENGQRSKSLLFSATTVIVAIIIIKWKLGLFNSLIVVTQLQWFHKTWEFLPC